MGSAGERVYIKSYEEDRTLAGKKTCLYLNVLHLRKDRRKEHVEKAPRQTTELTAEVGEKKVPILLQRGGDSIHRKNYLRRERTRLRQDDPKR